jgi:hypothetical protein
MLVVSRMKLFGPVYAAAFFASAALLCAQQVKFDGTWQMDAAKSKVADGRVVALTISSVDGGIKMNMKTQKKDGTEANSEFINKLNGKASDFTEGDHKSQITVWYNGPTLNASKESGPAGDVTSAWKFEMGPDKGTMTLTISHYEPAADDETLVFTKK